MTHKKGREKPSRDGLLDQPPEQKSIQPVGAMAASEPGTSRQADLEREALYQGLFESVNSVILVIDPETARILDANRAASEFYGYSHEALTNLRILDLAVLPSDEAWRRLKKTAAGEMHYMSHAHRLANGEIRDLEIYTNPVNYHGKVANIAVIYDISERKKIETSLRESEERFRHVLESSFDVSYRRNLRTDAYDYMSPMMVNLTGYHPDEMVRMPTDETLGLIHPDDLDRVGQIIGFSNNGGPGPYQVDYRFRHKAGHYIWLSDLFRVVRDDEGQLLYRVGTIRDITASKQVERALRESEERYKAQFKYLPIPTYIWQRRGGDFVLIDYNDETLTFTGGRVVEMVGKTASDVYADDPQVLVDFANCYGSRKTITRELPLHVAEEIRDFELIYAFISPDLVIVHSQDITERKKAEERIRQSEENFRLLLNSAAEGIYGIDQEGRCTFCNQSALTMLGFDSIGEVIGKNTHALIHHSRSDGSPNPESECKVYRANRAHGDTHSDEDYFWTRDGSVFPVEYWSYPIWHGTRHVGSVITFFDISERKRSSELRQASEERFNTAFRASKIGINIFRMPDGVVVDVNDSFLAMVDLERGEILGRSAAEIGLGLDFQHGSEWSERLLQQGSMKDVEASIRTRSGELRYLLLSFELLQRQDEPLVMLLCVDLTLQKQAELALKERLKELTCLHQVGLLVEQPGMRLDVLCQQVVDALVNAMQLPVWAVALLDIEGRHFQAGMLTDLHTNQLTALIKVNNREHGCLRVFYPPHATFLVPHEQYLLDDLANMLGLWLERTQSDESVRRLSRAKDEFLAAMSHELRTPLTGILGLAQVLLLQTYGDLNEKQTKALQSIEKSGNLLRDLINEVIDFSRLQTGTLDLRPDVFSLVATCLDSIKTVKMLALEKKHQLVFNINPDTILLNADELRVKQIIHHLLSNAIKFTPDHGQIELLVSGLPAEKVVQISVIDNGIGIAQEDMERLFQPFVQLDSRLARLYNGTGLGLAMVKMLAELHGGRVSVESEFGKGSRFNVFLPWVE